MEDYSRDLEKELNKYSVPNPFKQARNWQLLFVSDDGKTIAVKRYKGLVISVLAFLIVALLFSCGLTVLYYNSMVEKKSLRLAVEKANKALNKATEEKELLNARLFFEKKNETQIVDDEVEAKTAAEIKNAKESSVVDKELKQQPVIEKMNVSVERLSITKTEKSKMTSIKFLIRNLSKLKRISGYVFVVLKPDAKTQKGWRTLPPVLLRDGEPSVPGRGRYFSINHFKTMNFKFKDTTGGGYRDVTIFVYSKPEGDAKVGSKVFESTYPVEIKIVKQPAPPKESAVKPKKTSGTLAEKGATAATAPPTPALEKKGTTVISDKLKENDLLLKTEQAGNAVKEKKESLNTIKIGEASDNAE